MSENDTELKITADTSSIPMPMLTENDLERFIRDMEKYKRRSNTVTYQWATSPLVKLTYAQQYPAYAEECCLEPEPLYNKHWA